MGKMSQYHVGVAAKAFAVGLFAYTECDVSVHFGPNQPKYDLTAKKHSMTLEIQ